MKQLKKFYLASFLKNQTYFVPIIIIFFQDLGLNYSQIFWVFTIGSVFSFLVEIPTGIVADLFGKRKSIILSKLIIFIAFVAFGFSYNFWSLLIANVLYELGKSFRSGTETAYVFDYLAENKNLPGYTKVKAEQKFFARISESIGTLIGGFLASKYGFNFVFFLAAIPAFVNFGQNLTWEKIKENSEKVSVQKSWIFAKEALKEVFHKPLVLKIVVNIMLFSAVFAALDKFVQPYMFNVGIPVKFFGVVYSVFLIVVAFVGRYAFKFEEKFGGVRVVNFLTLISFIPLIILGLGYTASSGVILFFFILMVENIRSPIANTIFHDHIASFNRATMGSVLALFKTSAQLVILPITGYLADFYSIYFAILMLSFVVLVNGILFKLGRGRILKSI